MLQPLRRDFWVGTLLILAFIVICHLLGLDTKLTAYYFDPVSQQFPLESSWFFETVLHDQMKKIPVLIGVMLLCRMLYLWWQRRWRELKTPAYLFLAMGLSAGLVGLIRAHDPAACPWGLTIYGGNLPNLAPYDFFQGGHGHCWPSGHAAAGYCMLAFFFWLREKQSRWSWVVLCVVLLTGGIMSWTQIARGAHFLSHTNWSLFFCWLVSGGLAHLWWPAKHRSSIIDKTEK